MNSIQNLEIHIIKKIIKLFLIVLLITFLLKQAYLEVFLGLLYGLLLNLINFLQLASTFKKALYMEPSSARVYAIFRYILRYFLMVVFLLIALKTPYINFAAVCMGFVVMKGAIFWDGFLRKQSPRR